MIVRNLKKYSWRNLKSLRFTKKLSVKKIRKLWWKGSENDKTTKTTKKTFWREINVEVFNKIFYHSHFWSLLLLFQDTSLMAALEEGQIKIVKYLAEKGADINAKANNGVNLAEILKRLCWSFLLFFFFLLLA